MESDNVSETIIEMREKVIDNLVWENIREDSDPSQWDIDLLKDKIKDKFGINLPLDNWVEEENFAGEELQDRINSETTDYLKKRKSIWIRNYSNY